MNLKRIFFLLSIIIVATTIMGCTEMKKTKKDYDLEKMEIATLAGGCFWCMEPPFEKLEGVVDVLSGYAGGTEENPTYDQVSSGITSHREAVRVIFDPKKITYENILNTYWKQIDPTDSEGQFADKGIQYTTAIFYHNNNQKEIAEKTKKELEESGKFKNPITTKILPFTTFFPAEEYHQDYYKKFPIRYEAYKEGSGRGPFIKNNWN